MGISINGYIEIRHAYMLEMGREAKWYGAVDLDAFGGTRDYLMYHSLFGIRDDANFEPIAPDRGLPYDASEAVLDALDIERGKEIDDLDSFGHTWVTFQELQAVDWNETALAGTAWESKDGQETGRGFGRRGLTSEARSPVEPVLGSRKEGMGLRPFSLGGLPSVSGAGCLVCLAFHLGGLPVLLQAWSDSGHIGVKAERKTVCVEVFFTQKDPFRCGENSRDSLGEFSPTNC